MAVVVREGQRDAGRAMANGARLKCPACGEGALFHGYLKVNPTCPACGEELFHHRADDLPPYLAILVVGHLLVGIMLHMEMVWKIAPSTYLLWMVPLAVLLPMAMLPSTKGAVVGLQWAQRMHGFDRSTRPADPALPENEEQAGV